jgi:hypothetical protein
MEVNPIQRIATLHELINLTEGSGLSCEQELIKSCKQEINSIVDSFTNESNE